MLFYFFETVGVAANSQKLRLNAYANYIFDDGFGDFVTANSYYNGKVEGGMQLGAGIEFMANPQYGVELAYFYKGSDAPAVFKLGTQAENTETFDVGLHYIMLSANRYMPNSSGKVEGYGGFTLGMLINSVESPSRNYSSSNTVFAWGARLGVNVWATEKIGIKLQTQLLAATKGTGGELYFSGWGPVTVPTYSTLWQFGFGTGLSYRLGR